MKYRFGHIYQTDYKVKENPPKNQPFPQFFFKKNAKWLQTAYPLNESNE